MKKVVIGLVVVILSIALLVTLPFMFKSNQEDYIDFSKVSENVDDNGKDDDTLRIGLISVAGDNKSYILEKELANYIGDKLNKKVKLIQKKSYSDINLLLKNNQIDVAFLSTGAYSLYEDKESLELLARPNRGKAYYHPIIITKNDSNINTIEELKNNSFAFVDTYSYSGYLVFNDYLKKNGTTANKFFSNSYFTHSHEESINQVINGRVSAAIVDDWALQYMSSNFSGIENNIKIIKTFPEVATGPVVTHKNYEDKEKIKQILLSIDKDDSIKNVLSQLQIEKYEETKASDYPDLISED
ncbi:phosphate/phosphite/phosphonate ABC transporter substrate-binding protein [Gemella sanguinis]|jgi:phosphate/phosphite/phosphonate ABC transporters, periplasmic binding protein|uniref:phosphate/phosphite/phosphonate ABC transporter substrate-binding protein n=1 Tax=Gemella sanguinis TaxID=84135 RepID=UPI0028EBBF07|nr:phosphate/phosphite/phosphonate ABC transporter substrate-binding protein [Gemella sanguinis]